MGRSTVPTFSNCGTEKLNSKVEMCYVVTRVFAKRQKSVSAKTKMMRKFAKFRRNFANFRMRNFAKCEISQNAKCEMRNFAKCEMRNAKMKFREMWKIFNFSGNAKFRIFRNETFSSNYISKLFVCHNCCRAVYFFSKQRLYKADGFEVNIYFSLPATKSNVKDSTFYQPDLSGASCGCQLSSSKM